MTDTLKPEDFVSLRVEADKFIDVAAFSVPGAKGKTAKINDGSYRSKQACQYAHCKDCAVLCTFKLRFLHVTHNNGDDIEPQILAQTNGEHTGGMRDAEASFDQHWRTADSFETFPVGVKFGE